MNAGRSLLPSPLLPRSSPHFKNSIPSSSSSSSSVLMPHETTTWVISLVPTASTVCHYSPSLLAEVQLADYKNFVPLKGDKVVLGVLQDLASLEQQEAVEENIIGEECEEHASDSYMKDVKSGLLYQPVLWRAPTGIEENSTSISAAKLALNDRNMTKEREERISDATPSLAKKAMMRREAALFAERSSMSVTKLDEPPIHCVDPEDSYNEILSKGQVFIRSKRLRERRSKRRNALRTSSDALCSGVNLKGKEKVKKIERGFDPDDRFKLILRNPETNQFLTATEEKYLFAQIQDLMKLEEAQERLRAQFNREPTVAEWAKCVGMSSKELQSCIHSGKRSLEKMALSNFRLVIHVARKYEGYGIDIKDLVQDGCFGLMKTFAKFKPKKGCRFATYAYWWIRQEIKKSIYKNSRIIRLPEGVYALLRKISRARVDCIVEGQEPSNDNIARRVGITTAKLAKLLRATRKPRSLQARVWSDDSTTLQEITADPNVEDPERIMEKIFMRQHVRDFLGILPTREKEIIEHRFGIYDGKPKTLGAIGSIYGLSNERIRQLQNRALDKLKKNAPAQGFEAYIPLLL